MLITGIIFTSRISFVFHLLSSALLSAYLSPCAPRAERVGAASEQALSIGEQNLHVVATVLHALALVLTGVALIIRGWPSGVLQRRQRG